MGERTKKRVKAEKENESYKQQRAASTRKISDSFLFKVLWTPNNDDTDDAKLVSVRSRIQSIVKNERKKKQQKAETNVHIICTERFSLSTYRMHKQKSTIANEKSIARNKISFCGFYWANEKAASGFGRKFKNNFFLIFVFGSFVLPQI